MPRDPKQTKTASAKLGSFRQKPLARPYLRPEERSEAFDKLVEDYRRYFRPDDPESNTLVDAMIYIAYRIHRHKLDEAAIAGAEEELGLQNGLAATRNIIQNLERLGSWTLTTLEYLKRLHTLDASEAMDDKAFIHNLGSFLQYPDASDISRIPTPVPPKTKPN